MKFLIFLILITLFIVQLVAGNTTTTALTTSINSTVLATTTTTTDLTTTTESTTSINSTVLATTTTTTDLTTTTESTTSINSTVLATTTTTTTITTTTTTTVSLETTTATPITIIPTMNTMPTTTTVMTTTTAAPITTLSSNITVKTTAWNSKFNNSGILGAINRTVVVHSLVHCTSLCVRTDCNAFTFKEVEGEKNCSLYQIEVKKENLIVENGSTVFASATHFCTSDIVGLHPVFCTDFRSCIKNRCRCKGVLEDEFGCYRDISFQRVHNPEPRLLEWFNLNTAQLKTPYNFSNLSIPKNCTSTMNCTIVFATPEPWNLFRTSLYGYWPSPVPLNIGPTITIMWFMDEKLHVHISEFDNVTEEVGAVPFNIKDEFNIICDGEDLIVQVGNISLTSPKMRKLQLMLQLGSD
ncbi:A-agglutinin anchorage subunit isoform X1 [Eurytemora carolleeae]|uniref:A-agglutinin anchorage subunit isoform X1 n=1 Tax=Eurytemora carolleeae TaxID=1294199 RepID=UPI000C780EB5|nr:A-agglutinin anchorage subunit isoform X1 [Eurytemora carolleeae]|eukprot:XP_023347565.1 A-agglutinin anchorage subunit-like isoform X1 [Eurytemora affinis]